MSAKTFIGRKNELQWLNQLWARQEATLLILYGRRRIGKTRLLSHWFSQTNQDGLYWTAKDTSPTEQLRSFSQAVYNLDNPDDTAPSGFTYSSWEQAFNQVARIATEKRFILFIDEVTYLIMSTPDFMGILQKTWDERLKNVNIMLGLSGSHVGLMQKEILSYDAPLYGRDTARAELSSMPFWTTRGFFPDYTPADRVAIYAMFGGIPAYWERLDPHMSWTENILNQLLPSSSWLTDEPRFLMRDFFYETFGYASILRAIAQGAETQKYIGEYTGLKASHVSSYLSRLRDAGFVKRHVPVTETNPSKSRSGRYRIVDPYLNFYYRFIAQYQDRLVLGGQKGFVTYLQRELPVFIQQQIWPKLCRDWLLMSGLYGTLPISAEKVGGFWKGGRTIDVVGIDRPNKNLILATCEWDTAPTKFQPIRDLINKTRYVLPQTKGQRTLFDEDIPTEMWNVYYVGFSANGWAEGVKEKAEQWLQEHDSSQWNMLGIKLVDLQQLDDDFAQWAY